MVIYAGATAEVGDAVWVVDVHSCEIEIRQPTAFSRVFHFGSAQVSPDNKQLYLARSDALNYSHSIQCVEVATGREMWQTAPLRDAGLTTLAISPDGRMLASGSGFEDPSIHVWDTATGRLLVRVDGHSSWVCKLAFSTDGRRLISASSDQSVRVWDTSTWTATKVLRGHRDEVHAVAVSASGHLVASASKDGDLMLWNDAGNEAE